MKAQALNAFIVGSEDAHQSEYVTDRDLRRSFISDFSGSAGTALITETKALLWTDGRYFDQAANELDGKSWTLMKAGEPGVPDMNDWLYENMNGGQKVGVDSFLMSASRALDLKSKLGAKGVELQGVEANPVDKVWSSLSMQPGFPKAPLKVHKSGGCHHNTKIEDLRDNLKDKNCSAFVVTMLDEICWLLNIRGADVECNPVAVAYVVVTMTETHLFIDSDKVTAEAAAHLGAGVQVSPYEGVESFLADLSASGLHTIAMDNAQANWRLYNAAGGKDGGVVSMVSPITMAKSLKNEHEQQGIRDAHVRDGVALTAFLCWLEKTVKSNPGSVTEYEVAVELEKFRGKMPGHVCPSFATIAGYGPNGAVIHYKPEESSALPLKTDSLFLLDSGGQYLDGTTDVTRTLHFGEASAYHRKCYTLVLKGHIALARLVFPESTIGSRLDALARMALWTEGLDYNHGTGHGVGQFLNVHEGPQGIGFRKRENEAGFAIGMTTSNEPGYYETGNFGIRIENVCITVEANTAQNFNGRKYCRFETVTMTPIKTDLMDLSLMTDDEKAWVDSYHIEVREKLLPGMKESFPEAVDYLIAETQPLSK
jgi:Xaa-Pro aminopeptidase